MAEYIERAAAIKALGERPLNWDDKPDEVQAVWDYDLHRRAILSVPAADVAPVVHAHWGEYEAFPLAPTMNGYPCSNCRMHFSASAVPILKYCPNCGAKMDGGNP